MLRGSRVALDKGQVYDLAPDVAAPLLAAGVIERIPMLEFTEAPPAERAVIPEPPRTEPSEAEPPEPDIGAWPPNKRIKKSPAEYLKAAPNGKWADLARQHVGE